jgi:hypothetical protein
MLPDDRRKPPARSEFVRLTPEHFSVPCDAYHWVPHSIWTLPPTFQSRCARLPTSHCQTGRAAAGRRGGPLRSSCTSPTIGSVAGWLTQRSPGEDPKGVTAMCDATTNDGALVAKPGRGQAQVVVEFVQVGAADVTRLDVLEKGPDPSSGLSSGA